MVLLFKTLSKLKITKDDNLPIEIVENIYIGSFAAADNKDALVNIGITHVIVAASSLKMNFPEEYKYIHLDILDSPEVDISKHFEITGNFIDECLNENGKILVHW